MNEPESTRDDISAARRVLALEAEGIRTLAKTLDRRFVAALDLLYGARGRIIVTGMGKSGLIMQKVAATLSSTGTPALFLHPAEALHGPLVLAALLVAAVLGLVSPIFEALEISRHTTPEAARPQFPQIAGFKFSFDYSLSSGCTGTLLVGEHRWRSSRCCCSS